MRTIRYAGACFAVLAVGTLGAAVLFDGRAFFGVVAAGGVALSVQVTAFALMERAPLGSRAFLAAWVGGVVARMAVVGLGGWVLVMLPDLPPGPTLLGLAGFLFVMLMLEPRYLGLGGT